MIRVPPAAALAVLVCTCVLAESRGKWIQIDDTDGEHKIVPLTTCASLESQTSRQPIEGNEKAATQVSPLGTVHGFKIYDVIQTVYGGRAFVKRIFVERVAGQFCEIYRFAGDDSLFYAPGRAVIIDTDGGQILATRSDVKGSAQIRLEAFWMFDDGGPIELKPYDVLRDAIKELLPEDRLVQKGYGLNLGRMCYSVPVWTLKDPACCGSAGNLFIKFALKATSLMVVEKEYDASGVSFEKREQECPRN